MPKQNTPLFFDVVTPGTFSDWQYFDPCQIWSVKSCDGNLRVQYGVNYPIMEPVVCGQQEIVERKFNRMRVTSTLAETVTISVGDDRTTDSRKLVTLGPGPSGITQVQGPQPYYVDKPKASFNNPIDVAMFHDNQDGTLVALPFQSQDMRTLDASPANPPHAAFYYSPMTIPNPKGATMRLGVANTGAAALTVLDPYGNVLPIYKDDGSAVAFSIPAGTVGQYYIPVGGIDQVTLSGDNAWSLWVFFSPFVFTPRP